MTDLRERISRRYKELAEPPIDPADTALMVIDVQFGDAHPDYGLLKAMRERGDGDITEHYARRLKERTVPNIQRLLEACRRAGIEVIHVGIRSLTKDGRDRSLEHKNANFHFAPGSIEAEFLAEVAPAEDEIVITKTCSGVFNGTNIDYVLRNLGVAHIIMCGVFTNGCVESAVRDAADRSFLVTLIEDACATWSDELQQNSINALSEIYAKVRLTDDVARQIDTLSRVEVTAAGNG